jgi:hypothetical protein
VETFMTRAAHVFLLCAFGVTLCGCNYFKPTQPEAPSGEQTFVPNYSDPDSTLATIAKSIGDKGRTIGGVAYSNAFADSSTAGGFAGYHQFYDKLDVASWESASGRKAPEWGFEQEQSFYNGFVQLRGDPFVCTWAPDDLNPDEVTSNVVTIHRHYLIVSQAVDGTQTSFLARGYADLRMLRFPDGLWRIVLWNDRRDPDAEPGDQEQVTLGFRRLTTPL